MLACGRYFVCVPVRKNYLYWYYLSRFGMPAPAFALEGRQESQSITDGMKATTKQRCDDPPKLGFVERYRLLLLTSPLLMAVLTIIFRSASRDFREATDLIFPPR